MENIIRNINLADKNEQFVNLESCPSKKLTKKEFQYYNLPVSPSYIYMNKRNLFIQINRVKRFLFLEKEKNVSDKR